MDWPLPAAQKVSAYGSVAASSRGTQVAASATPNTKGSWTQIVAATDAVSAGLLSLSFARGSVSLADFLFDIGVGAAASEQIIVPDLLVTANRDNEPGGQIILPISVSASTRIAARCQSTTGSAAISVEVQAVAPTFSSAAPLGRCTAYGAATADSGGTQVDPGGTANTKGAWSEITASTTAPVSALLVALGGQVNTDRLTANYLLDIGVGAAASEQVLIPDLFFTAQALTEALRPTYFLFPIAVPASTRLAARAQSTTNDATDRLFDVVLYGVD